jgi:SAM-dependent methyltransferase
MAKHNSLYQRAVYYDIIFDRDVRREVDFMIDVYRRYVGSEPRSVLDIACGPGYHAREFARRGARAVGLDLRPEMVDFAREKDAAEGLSLEWIAQDMRDYSLAEPVDLAFIVFDGLDALTCNEDVVHHFRAVAANLTSHGLYIIDLTHPREISYTDYGKYFYRSQSDGIAVEIAWAVNAPRFDLVTSTARVEVEMRVNDHGKATVIKDEADERLFFPQDLTLLAALSGALEPLGWYGDFHIDQPLDYSEASRRQIAVMKKKEDGVMANDG